MDTAEIMEVPWAVEATNAPKLWQQGLTGDKVRIALIDTGVNIYHPDFSHQAWFQQFSDTNDLADYCTHNTNSKVGYNFIDDSVNIHDKYGHGSNVASQILGNGISGIKTGIAFGAQAIPLVVDNHCDEFFAAIEHAITLEVDLINISKSLKLHNHGDPTRWLAICKKALTKNITICCSVGNQGDLLKSYPIPINIGYPACLPSVLENNDATAVIAIGVSNQHQQVHHSSGIGPSEFIDSVGNVRLLVKPDICVPGSASKACNSLYPHRSKFPYCDFMGSSSATAHLTGCLALLVDSCKRSRNPILPMRFAQALIKSSIPFDGQTQIPMQKMGAGRINIHAAWLFGKAKGWWY